MTSHLCTQMIQLNEHHCFYWKVVLNIAVLSQIWAGLVLHCASGLIMFFSSDVVQIGIVTWMCTQVKSTWTGILWDQNQASPPPFRLTTMEGRTFSLSSPPTMEFTPPDLRNTDSLPHFKSQLKTHLFRLSYSLWVGEPEQMTAQVVWFLFIGFSVFYCISLYFIAFICTVVW